MAKLLVVCFLLVGLTTVLLAADSLPQNISCADPPLGYEVSSEIEESESESVSECRNWADCDPYGFSMCSEHKKWAEKCCALYCNFCH